MITTNLANLDKWQASLKKAVEERVRVWHTKQIGWRAHSAGSKEIYSLNIIQLDNGCIGIQCSCRGYQYYNYCKHIARLAMKLSKQGRSIRLP